MNRSDLMPAYKRYCTVMAHLDPGDFRITEAVIAWCLSGEPVPRYPGRELGAELLRSRGTGL